MTEKGTNAKKCQDSISDRSTAIPTLPDPNVH